MTNSLNTNWDNIPHTNSNAQQKSERRVVDVLAIRVESASIRGATVSGIFELADNPQPITIYNGDLRAEVKCFWYNRKPTSTWMHLSLSKKWELIRNYSGEVVDNIE
jgi:hypothetical protein